MSRFVEAKSDQLNADDLIGAPRTITVTRVTGNDGDQPVSIFYEGDNGKPFKPCKTMRRVLLAVWGRYAADYVGRSMRIYRDDKVTFGGLDVGGIRISHMSHIDKETVVVVMKTKGKKAGIKILPLKAEPEQQKRDPAAAAADWTATHIGLVETAMDDAALHELRHKAEKTLARLAENHPELRSQISAAYDRRFSELQEKRGETDMGEAISGAEEAPPEF
ncbi:hypothetical protein [Sphingobium sp. SYK-6]|uniref:hypothetical protein n=1 Tax=Sphingobium sp. (strain NBRC 103272 / SYK-6) TaxID=627192 RepID=UPI0011D24E11|nr:hypothetical protein [Sphingobium sp. SYK-6]